MTSAGCDDTIDGTLGLCRTLGTLPYSMRDGCSHRETRFFREALMPLRQVIERDREPRPAAPMLHDRARCSHVAVATDVLIEVAVRVEV